MLLNKESRIKKEIKYNEVNNNILFKCRSLLCSTGHLSLEVPWKDQEFIIN